MIFFNLLFSETSVLPLSTFVEVLQCWNDSSRFFHSWCVCRLLIYLQDWLKNKLLDYLKIYCWKISIINRYFHLETTKTLEIIKNYFQNTWVSGIDSIWITNLFTNGNSNKNKVHRFQKTCNLYLIHLPLLFSNMT